MTFHYKNEIDPESIPQFGLIAEEVEKIDRDLVARDEEGKAYTVRYEAVNAMLLNEFLKAHRTVQQQQTTITELKESILKQQVTNARQQRQIDALIAGFRKISDRDELNKHRSRLVPDND